MSGPLVFSCILLTILATAQLTYQKSVLSTSKEDEPLHRRQPRATKDGSITLLIDRWTIVGYIVAPPRVLPENNHLCPKGQTFCDGANDNFTDLSTNKKPSNVPLQENKVKVNKFQAAEPGSSFCRSTSKVIFPKQVRSKDGTFKYTVNNENYKEGMRVETCSADGEECMIPGVLASGYISKCVQKYISRSLVFNTNSFSGDGVVNEIFEFPSHCSCEIVRDPNWVTDRSKVTGGKDEIRVTPVAR